MNYILRTVPRANRLKELRLAAGLTPEMLAARIPGRHAPSISAVTIKRWEEGANIPSDRWDVLAELFGVSVAHLLDLDGDGDNGGQQKRAA